MTEEAEEALVNQAKDGDRQAFATLVSRYIDGLYKYAMLLVRNPSLAEDLVQDTWLTAWLKLHSYTPQKAALNTWLHRILHNKFIDETRKSRWDAVGEPSTEIADGTELIADAADAEMKQLVKVLIGRLPENQRAALTLSYFQGFSNTQVAQILGLKLRATESLIARARKTLTNELECHEAILNEQAPSKSR